MIGTEVLISVGIVICVGFVIVWKMFRRRPAGLKEIPGPSGWPVVGNFTQIDQTKFHTYLLDQMCEFGDIFQINMLGNKIVMVNSSQTFNEMSGKIITRPFNVNGLLAYDSRGLTWSNITGIQPKVREMVIKSMHEIGKTDRLAHKETELFVRQLEETDCDVDVTALSSDAVARQFVIMLTGEEPAAEDSEAILNYCAEVGKLFEGGLAFKLSALPCLRHIPLSSFKQGYDENERVMKIAVNLLMDKSSKSDAGLGVISSMQRYQKENNADTSSGHIDDDTIRAVVAETLSGGCGTTKGYLAANLLCIAKNPEVQKKIHAEMDIVCNDKPPTEKTMERLPYLAATIFECWRYNSRIPLTVPHLAEADTNLCGYDVPKGTTVFGNIFNIHHDKGVWGDPWEFRPERWLDESGVFLPEEHPSRQSLLPFGATGPRYCKGKDYVKEVMYRCMSTILYSFRLCPPAEGKLPDNDPRTFKYGGGLFVPQFHCRLEKRV